MCVLRKALLMFASFLSLIPWDFLFRIGSDPIDPDPPKARKVTSREACEKCVMAPKIRIQAHVASFGGMVLVGTAVALGISKVFGQTDEEKERTLRAKFPERTKQNEAQRVEMQKFFDKMKANNAKKGGEGEQNGTFSDILHGGRGNINRASNNAEAVQSYNKSSTKE